MTARIGDLAIARFDPCGDGKKWDEHVCLVTGREKSEMSFVYWETNRRGTEMHNDALPKSRLVRVRPKYNPRGLFDGDISQFTLDNVEIL